jgi:uncharacterized repeat protein (TIGR03803 family)
MAPLALIHRARKRAKSIFLAGALLLHSHETPGQRRFERWRGACAVFLLCAAATVASPAQTFVSLADFNWTNGGDTGATPDFGNLVQGLDGNLYGTTTFGGSGNNGTVFRIGPHGSLTSLYSFCSLTNCADGSNPQAGLVQGEDGNFYGTTSTAGTHNGGTVFRITRQGALTTLHNFCARANCADGSDTSAALVLGIDGNFYGTTEFGGANNEGTVFRITPGGTVTTLYSFCSNTNCADGFVPQAALIQATNGNFYGTTSQGGANGFGTVFRITRKGVLTTIHSFTGTDGAFSSSALVEAGGNLYGTASEGGVGGFGTVFKITPQGVLTAIHTFSGSDGAVPTVGLVLGTDRSLYGTTSQGGSGQSGSGTIFKITPAGTLTTLYDFCSTNGCPDGFLPYGGLVQHTNGKFYGKTNQGGTSIACAAGCGTVFSLGVGLGAFVETLPTSGKVGAEVKILGTNLTGTTSVSFNGTAATFTVVSASEISTTVPTNATTGKVKVTTPSGTLTSNIVFRVP